MEDIDETDQQDDSSLAIQPSVTVCRGCCCGTFAKHPEVDHEDQLRRLRAAGSQVRAVQECLGHCERSNVMVVMPSRLGRLFGGRPIWVGQVLAPETLGVVVEWVAAGGPGLAPVPEAMRGAVFVPPRPVTT